ncbi:MAG: DinB family protein [Fuerstiella sp.]
MSTDISDLISAFASGPEKVRSLTQQLSDVQLDAVPVAGKWSIRQVICHLVDADLEYCQRIKRVLVEDNPTLQELGPDAFAAALHYPARNVADELDLLTAARRHMAAILKATDVENFQRTGVHSAEGPMTLETLLERITGHIDHHVAFIEEKLKALGEA